MKTTMYDAPREVWLANNHTLRAFRVTLRGETRLSWKTGAQDWAITNQPKADWRLVTESEADEIRWALANRYRIEKGVGFTKDAAILRQIAALIGYKEPS